jgi:[FeFe] hydrogenase H-cluster maturation GTPase HydF
MSEKSASLNEAPKAVRFQIGLFGRTNTGKSSLLNYIAGSDVAVTSPVAGTTTDVVEKAMELLPLGPVLWLDTGGLDDASALGDRRRQKSAAALRRCDAVILVLESAVWGEVEDSLLKSCAEHKRPLILVVNKTDLHQPSADELEELRRKSPHVLSVSCRRPEEREAFLAGLKSALQAAAPESQRQAPSLLADLVPAGGLAVFVVPIDLQAPKGRLILPQVQSIREVLDSDAAALVVKERELTALLARLQQKPDLVVCDSQAVLKVTADVPPEVPCTTFSILFARAKGDLVAAAGGAGRLSTLREGDRVLVAEACTHHALEDDIGRVKIPRWLRQYAGVRLDISVCSGRDFPKDLSAYQLVIHCGACTLNRREMLSRLDEAKQAGVPVTNYGVAIAALQGVAARVLKPFPAAQEAFLQAQAAGAAKGSSR